MLYKCARNALFQLDPETSHDLSMASLKLMAKTPAAAIMKAQVPDAPRKIWGIDFPNPVGLAAGLDKHADYLDGVAAMGFGRRLAVVSDATAAAVLPDLDGYTAAMVNFRMIANTVWTTSEAVEQIAGRR